MPAPEKMRLQGLRQKVVVGNRVELPHGLWRKTPITTLLIGGHDPDTMRLMADLTT